MSASKRASAPTPRHAPRPASPSTSSGRIPQMPTATSPLSSSSPAPISTAGPPTSGTRLPPMSPTTAKLPPTSPTAASKLPRFLQSPAQRDRSKSLSVDRPGSAASSAASHSTSTSASTSSTGGGRRFLGLGKDKAARDRERDRARVREAERGAPSAAELLTLQENASPTSYDFDDDAPPSSYGGTARPRTRSERHFSASTPPSSSGHGETLQLARSPSRLGLGADGALASRLSGWFAHLAGSTSDLSLTSTISGSIALASSTSSRALGSSTRKEAGKTPRKSEGGSGGGGSKTSLLDKAVRYLLDGDAAPDRSTAEIWVLGTALFHAHFYAQVWCTYRAGFEPIRDLPSLGSLPPPLTFPPTSSLSDAPSPARPPPHGGGHSPAQSDSSAGSAGSSYSHAHGYGHSQTPSAASHGSAYSTSTASSTSTTGSQMSSSSKKKWWPLGGGGMMGMGGTKGWTSDAGWGCMLRTGQSLLAAALGRVGDPHPSGSTRPPSFPPHTPSAHAAHARLLSWFLDAPAAPFSVHRMALAGKAAGKDVGMWFGPSAAAGAVRTLVDAFPICGLGVSVGTDGTLYQNEVFAASHSPTARAALHAPRPSGSHNGHGHGHHTKPETKAWGDRPVLLLLGMRLGLDGVNPVYHETIKLLYTFPQSVGIAGGRPSSSYYFIGVQGDGLFYLDPHHSRPTVPHRPYFPDAPHAGVPSTPNRSTHTAHGTPDARRSLSPEAYVRGGSLSPEPPRAGSMSPELGYVRGGSMSPEYGYGRGNTPMTEDELFVTRDAPTSLSSSGATSATLTPDHHSEKQAGGPLSPAEEAHFARAYSAAELRTFHCERVRKMPLSGLDPSMLLGFVCRDEAEWVDLRRRVGELPRTIFAIQDEPPSWPGADDDDDMLESISDPEEEAALDDGDVSSASHAPPSSESHAAESSASHAVSSASHVAASTFSHTHQHSNSNSTATSNSTASSGDVDTEEDAVAPITPLPGSRFDLSSVPPLPSAGKSAADAYGDLDPEGDEGDDGFVDAASEAEIEDDWVDPVPTPSAPPPNKKERDRERAGKSKAKGSSKTKKAVPVPSVHYPFPVSVEDGAGAGTGTPQERQERMRNVTVSPRAGAGAAAGQSGQRMHTARARDGGRTQSGGVRGVLTED
ncbi:peptidase family C54-domain-containing protein [Mycena belliarum]|uniref:Autophagy-related protein 4 n=1 Tax=Mycena belliarum TaxID=1033014 RepID=A0AAD6TP58_9AGAR|nr:peptidase family C54-domain-containing protein [Mycena belliae]